jgi:hypothetical protein
VDNILERQDGMVWIGLIWLRIGTSRVLLWTRLRTFGVHKILGSSWVAAKLSASQEGLSSTSERVIPRPTYEWTVLFNTWCWLQCAVLEEENKHVFFGGGYFTTMSVSRLHSVEW